MDWQTKVLSAPAGAAVFLVLALALYWPAIHCGFIFDDNVMVTGNNLVKIPDGLRYIWFSTVPVDYFPLTYSSLWAEWHLWGAWAMGYHVTNILLHAGSAVILWRLLTGLRVPGALFGSLLFLVHPVNVESVAWIAERKNTLAMVFCLLSLLLYLRWEEAREAGIDKGPLPAAPPRLRSALLYWLSLLAFLLSLLSKTAGVMLPFALLGIAWWRRGRIRKPDLFRALPFFGLSLALGLITIWFQYHRAIGGDFIHQRDAWVRLAAAGTAVWFYLAKAVCPISLAFVYPEWKVVPSDFLTWLPDLALVGAFAVLWRPRRSWGRAGLFVLAYYVVMLFPILGFFNIYFQKYSFVADHWQYFALPAIVAGIAAWLDRAPWQTLRRGLLAALVAACALLSWRQQWPYRDAETLWHETLKQDPSCWMAHINLGTIAQARGQLAEASSHYQRSIQAHPSQIEGYNNLGLLLFGQGKDDEALAQFQRALEVNPNVAMTHLNIGGIFVRRGQVQKALAEFREAERLQPSLAEAHNNLGCLLLTDGKPTEAAAEFREALRWKPEYIEAIDNLAHTLVVMGRPQEALPLVSEATRLNPSNASAFQILGDALNALGQASQALAEYAKAVELNPKLADVHYKMGDMLLRSGKLDEAAKQYSVVLAAQPDSAEAHYQLAIALGARNQSEEAIRHLREAVRLRPGWVEALNNLAWMLATQPDRRFRDGPEALRLAKRAVELTNTNNAGALDTLAAAWAETGQYADARDAARHAVQMALGTGQTNLAGQIQDRLRLYQQGQPFRETPATAQ